jgi:hypothetical protein
MPPSSFSATHGRSIILVLLLLSMACARPDLYKRADRRKWVGQANGHVYEFDVTSSRKYLYEGRLTMDRSDTLLLDGFWKGSVYPSAYYSSDSLRHGNLFLWYQRLRRSPDRLWMYDVHPPEDHLPDTIMFLEVDPVRDTR